MHSLEEPDAPRGRGLSWILLVAVVATGAGAWYVSSRPAVAPAAPAAATTAPADSPTTANEPASPTERRSTPPVTAPPAAGRRPSRTETDKAATAAPSAPAPTPTRELRVTSDVPGAYVFLDRKFLGTTPFVSRDVSPGAHQLNVQMEGRPPVVRTVDILADAPTEVAVTLAAPPPSAAPAISAQVAVVHQHGVGSCEGTLRASPEGLAYVTAHKDAFTLGYASIETFTVDYTEKRLRLKQRGGRTWNFTTKAETADPLFVFHRDVDAARPH